MLINIPLQPIQSENVRADYIRFIIQGIALGAACEWLGPDGKPRFPPLYRSGIRYRLEPQHGSGNEEFAPPWLTAARGWGDCDDLVIYRVAELIASGEKASCYTMWPEGSKHLHVLVRRGDNRLEDPSIILGALRL